MQVEISTHERKIFLTIKFHTNLGPAHGPCIIISQCESEAWILTDEAAREVIISPRARMRSEGLLQSVGLSEKQSLKKFFPIASIIFSNNSQV